MSKQTAKVVVAWTLALGAIFELVAATAHLHGWLWVAIRAANAVVFVFACAVWLIALIREKSPRGA